MKPINFLPQTICNKQYLAVSVYVTKCIAMIIRVTFVVACAAGCRACTGPNNADCLACEDETLYRVTTNQPASSACVTAAECETPTISTFGDRICDMVIIITTPTSKLPTTPTESSALPTVSPTTQGVSLELSELHAI